MGCLACSGSASSFDRNLQNWDLPRISSAKVYDGARFRLRSDSLVQTHEGTVPLKPGCDTFLLLPQSLIVPAREKYKFLHVGLVQLGLKPLNRQGLNTSALVALRDRRFKKFEDSLLGIVKSTMHNGPIYFNCCPNLPVSLSDPNVHLVLSLNVNTSGFDMLEDSENVLLTYRVCYKLMNTLKPNIKATAEIMSSKVGETKLFLTNMSKSSSLIARTVIWSQVEVPETWRSQEASPQPQSDVEAKVSTSFSSAFEKNLRRWKLPRISSTRVYPKRMLQFRSDDDVHTFEETIPLKLGCDTIIHLLPERMIQRYLSKYKTLHLGIVQVGLKPLNRQGLRTSALVALRDSRLLQFEDSLMGIVESTLQDGPIYFNEFLDYSVAVADPGIRELLSLNVKTSGFDALEGQENVLLIYRVCCKFVNDPEFCSRAKWESKSGETKLHLTNMWNPNSVVEKTIYWDQVTVPETWRKN